MSTSNYHKYNNHLLGSYLRFDALSTLQRRSESRVAQPDSPRKIVSGFDIDWIYQYLLTDLSKQIDFENEVSVSKQMANFFQSDKEITIPSPLEVHSLS